MQNIFLAKYSGGTYKRQCARIRDNWYFLGKISVPFTCAVLFIKLKGTHGPLTTPSEFILYPNPSSSNFYFLPFTINFLSSQFMFASSCCLNRLEKYFLNEIIQKVVKLKKYLCNNFKFACPKPNGA